MLARITAHPPWRQLLLVSVALPLVVGLAVLVFAWPAGHQGPRHLPVGIVGADVAAGQVVDGLASTHPDAFDLSAYADEASARRAIEDRDVYGAFDVSGRTVTVYTASAASPSVAMQLQEVGQELQRQLTPDTPAATPGVVDVVPTAAADPRGFVLSSSMLPLTICGIFIAAAIALALRFGPAWRLLLALATVSLVAGLAVFLVGQTDLGAFPHQGVATWASFALIIFAMSVTAAGLITLIGAPGLGLAAVLMVIVGNSLSGASSAPEMLPDVARQIGESLPPGAAVGLVRSVSYFDGRGAGTYLAVLLAWSAFGVIAVVGGHRTFTGFAARRRLALQATREGRHSDPAAQALTGPRRAPAQLARVTPSPSRHGG